jgi:hypothetical protein
MTAYGNELLPLRVDSGPLELCVQFQINARSRTAKLRSAAVNWLQATTSRAFLSVEYALRTKY